MPLWRPEFASERKETMTAWWLAAARRPKPYRSVVVFAVTMVVRR